MLQVSIITPYLNSEATLSEAIGSIEDQTFADWELILVDDGSRDRGRVIADAAAARDQRIRSLVRPSGKAGGAAAARNYGIAQSAGRFLAFLDADDRFLSDKLSTELELFARHPTAAMVFGGAIWWYPGEDERNWSDTMRMSPGVYAPPLLVDRVFLLQRDHVPPPCSVTVRREALVDDQPFDERFRLYEDQTMMVKIALVHPVYVGRHLTSLYRQHSGSTSSLAERGGEYHRIGPHVARTEFLAWIREHAERRGSLARSTRDALEIAEAVQSGNRSGLTLRQRAVLLGFALQDRIKRIARPVRKLLRRANLRVPASPS